MMLAGLALAAGTFAASYDCTLESPKALHRDGGKATVTDIQFPGISADDWRFQVKVTKKKEGLNAEIVWPSNPIQIAGKFAGLVTADGSIAFTTFSPGPCMFTESMCMSLVQLVDDGAGSAKLIVTPTALATDRDANTRQPFLVVAEGTCSRAEDKK